MSTPYVLLGLFALLTGLVGVAAYAVKRYFDDRSAARAQEQKLSSEALEKLVALTAALESNGVLVRERLGVFEAALKNAITQFAEIVSSTKESELQNKARIAGALIKSGRRMPAP